MTTRDGRPLATVTFTLVDSQPQDDRKYQLRGHLKNPDAPPEPPPPRFWLALGLLRRAS